MMAFKGSACVWHITFHVSFANKARHPIKSDILSSLTLMKQVSDNPFQGEAAGFVYNKIYHTYQSYF